MIKIKNKDDAAALLIAIHGETTEEQIVKLWDAVRRNTKVGGRDGVFWEPGATGYQTCPLTGMRKAIFDNRTVSILGFTYDEYVTYLIKNDLPAPNKTTGFMDDVNAKLREKDPETGKSKRDLLNEKSRATLLEVGEDGLTGYERKGIKTKETHLANVDSNGLNGYERIAAEARTKQNETMSKAASNTRERFRYFVDWLGLRHRDFLLEGKIRGKMGTEGAEQVDHIFPVMRGYDESVSPWVLAHALNMHVVPWEENASRTHNDIFTAQTLHAAIGYDLEQSRTEFDLVMSILEEMDNYNGGKLLELFNERSSIPKYRY